MRLYALDNIPSLTEAERHLLTQTEPTIGHANYSDYYFTWTNPSDGRRLVVESSPPFGEPGSAYRADPKRAY